MINYVIYNNQGTIVQQGETTAEQLDKIKNSLNGLGLLVVREKIDGASEYKVEDGQIVPRETAQSIDDYKFNRYHNFAYVGEQLDLLYKDIQAGVFGEAAKTGQFAAYISTIKGLYPKP